MYIYIYVFIHTHIVYVYIYIYTSIHPLRIIEILPAPRGPLLKWSIFFNQLSAIFKSPYPLDRKAPRRMPLAPGSARSAARILIHGKVVEI